MTTENADDLAASDSVLASGSGLSSLGGFASGGGTADQELIIFLCPNGHKLHGLKRLAGKIGACPHCGAKFEIPFPDEVDEQERDGLDDTVTEDPLGAYESESSAEDESSLESEPSKGGETPAELESLFEAVRADKGSSVLKRLAARSGKGKKATDSATSAPPPQPADPTVSESDKTPNHPLAELLARLWAEREHGGVIELHLTGGMMLVPEWFDERQSRGSHGLFAAQAADGTVTMTVVPWDEVSRVVVRGVVGLPDGMFE